MLFAKNPECSNACEKKYCWQNTLHGVCILSNSWAIQRIPGRRNLTASEWGATNAIHSNAPRTGSQAPICTAVIYGTRQMHWRARLAAAAAACNSACDADSNKSFRTGTKRERKRVRAHSALKLSFNHHLISRSGAPNSTATTAEQLLCVYMCVCVQLVRLQRSLGIYARSAPSVVRCNLCARTLYSYLVVCVCVFVCADRARPARRAVWVHRALTTSTSTTTMPAATQQYHKYRSNIN